jgi:hypothetical protein
MNPTQAIHNRDPDALDRAFDNLQEAEAFRNEVLPSLSPDDCLWFWMQVMTPEQLTRTFEAMRDVALAIAQSRHLVPHEVQGGHLDGRPVVYATPNARAVIFAEISSERHSFLNALLIPFP